MSATLRVMIACVALALCHSASAAVSREDIDRFIASDPRTYSHNRSDEIRDILIKRLPARSFDAAVNELAKKWRLPRAAAAFAAEAEIKAQIAREGTPAERTAYVPIYLAALDAAPSSTPL